MLLHDTITSLRQKLIRQHHILISAPVDVFLFVFSIVPFLFSRHIRVRPVVAYTAYPGKALENKLWKTSSGKQALENKL
jgi:hypothetical protein